MNILERWSGPFTPRGQYVLLSYRIRYVPDLGSKHNNIIVELSEGVDIEPIIGEHAHRRFLKAPYDATNAVSYIYEYDYEKQNDPTRRNWAARYPSQYDITNFPFKDNYPIPTPAPLPPSHVNYAKRPSVVPVPCPTAVVDEQFPGAPARPNCKLSPFSLPREEQDTEPVMKKRDPYETGLKFIDHLQPSLTSAITEDEAKWLLRSVSQDFTPKQEQDTDHGPHRITNAVNGIIKKEESMIPSLKREQDADTVEEFLASVSVKKEESVEFDRSRHLSEPTKEEEYQPSTELLAAFADLPMETFTPLVKEEPPSETHPAHRRLISNRSYSDHLTDPTSRERSTTLATDFGDTGPSSLRIKPEPKDDNMLPPPPPHPFERTRDPRRNRSVTLASDDGRETVRVKPEPQDSYEIPATTGPERQMDDSRTYDPRLARRGGFGDHAIPPSSSLHTGDPKFARHGEPMFMKSEPRDDYMLPPRAITRDPRLTRREGGEKRPFDDESEAGK
ncbi:hypothetical protein DXG01_013170 [Tephrocybe rancida]|nr:hypothetical protein DXG01_013170 [Tephrocybe rancida]